MEWHISSHYQETITYTYPQAAPCTTTQGKLHSYPPFTLGLSPPLVQLFVPHTQTPSVGRSSQLVLGIAEEGVTNGSSRSSHIPEFLTHYHKKQLKKADIVYDVW